MQCGALFHAVNRSTWTAYAAERIPLYCVASPRHIAIYTILAAERFLHSAVAQIANHINSLSLVLIAVELNCRTKKCPICGVRVAKRIMNMETPFAIATNVEKEPGNNYRIDIEIIVPVTPEKFRLDLNELVDQPRQIGGFPPSGEWGNVVVTTCGLPRLKAGDKVPVVVQE